MYLLGNHFLIKPYQRLVGAARGYANKTADPYSNDLPAEEEEEAANNFDDGEPFEPETWSPMRICGIVLLFLTIISYTGLFLLAARRRQRLENAEKQEQRGSLLQDDEKREGEISLLKITSPDSVSDISEADKDCSEISPPSVEDSFRMHGWRGDAEDGFDDESEQARRRRPHETLQREEELRESLQQSPSWNGGSLLSWMASCVSFGNARPSRGSPRSRGNPEKQSPLAAADSLLRPDRSPVKAK
jgi:hypothetical protein